MSKSEGLCILLNDLPNINIKKEFHTANNNDGISKRN